MVLLRVVCSLGWEKGGKGWWEGCRNFFESVKCFVVRVDIMLKQEDEREVTVTKEDQDRINLFSKLLNERRELEAHLQVGCCRSCWFCFLKSG